ncbi:MAG TPA: transcription antitermination factor NusB, partial [Ilumatobacteraceae bacterium]|nr:transcription antitermination factor NusB [Ilumatobacteraceae bacterium]
MRIDHHGAYANLVVPAALADGELDLRDRGFVTDIVYGTTRMRRACDALVDRFLQRPPRPTIRTLLRMGAYQLHFAGTAAHGAVNETVQLAPKAERGFVNAVLRRVIREPMEWSGSLGEVLSYPDWIVAALRAELGDDDGELALRAMNDPAVTHRRDDGYIQDTGSQWVVDAVGAQPGERILDLCAAPGGKATGIANRDAWVVAADVNAARVGLIAHNVRTLRSDVSPIVADGTQPPFAVESFDRVLIDAP